MLCGRERERDRLWERCQEAASGHGGLLLIRGEAGIGKSHLAADLADRARRTGFAVGSGAATPLLAHPFEPVLRALRVDDAASGTGDDARKRVRSLLDQPDRPRHSAIGWAGAGRSGLLDALCAVASDAAVDQPLLLLIEDLHWSAQATLVALARLHALAQSDRILVVATTRPNGPDEILRGISAIGDLEAETIDLGPLHDDAVDELVRRLVGTAPGASLRRRISATGGNPLFITELVTGLLVDGAIDVASGRAETNVDTLPSTLTAQVIRKIDELPVAARELLGLAAVLGHTFHPDDLAIASGRPPSELLTPINEAVRAGLLVDRDGRLSFRHELVQSVVYEQMPRSVRLSIHRQVATSLAAQHASPHRIAAHHLIAGEPGDTVAIDALATAARSLTTTAPHEAVTLFDRALALEDVLERRVVLLADRLEAIALAGRVGDAQAHARELIHLMGDVPRRLDVQMDLARVLLIANQPDEAASIFEAVAAADGERRALALAEASLCALAAGQPDRAHANAVAALVVRAVDDDVDPAARSLALSMQSRLAVHDYDFETSEAFARRAVEVADRSPGLEAHRYQPLFFLGLTLHDLDRLDDLLDVVDVGRGVAQRLGNTFAVPLYDALEAFTHLRAGRIAACAAQASAAIAGCAATESNLALAYAHALLAIASLHQGDVEGAAASVAAGERAGAEAPPLLGSDILLLATGLVREATGDRVAALETLVGALRLFEAIGLPHMAAPFVGDIVRLASALGDDDVGGEAVALLEHGATKLGLPSWRAGVLEARGVLDRDADALGDAAALYAQTPRRMLVARACELRGALLLEHDGADDAIGVLRDAFEIYESCGAARDRTRVAAALRAAGGRPRRSTVITDRTDVLSPKEREVVDLVALGLSNTDIAERLFVSKRTVESHLRRIFSKLDVSSRLELVFAVRRDVPTGASRTSVP
jgi:DNA-binding CsgD family transcriptional regulator